MNITQIFKSNYHDDEIVGVEYNRNNSVLKLHICKSLNDEVEILKLDNVIDLDFTPFKFQNVIFSISVYDRDSLSSALIDEFEIKDFYFKDDESKDYKFVLIDSSIGMSGYVVIKGSIPEKG